MELGNLEETRDAYQEAKNAEVRAEEGEEVTLLLANASGEVNLRKTFKTGVTVAYVKMVLQQKTGLPMATTQLKVDGKPLIDPLSLSDCAGIASGEEVEVEVVAA